MSFIFTHQYLKSCISFPKLLFYVIFRPPRALLPYEFYQNSLNGFLRVCPIELQHLSYLRQESEKVFGVSSFTVRRNYDFSINKEMYIYDAFTANFKRGWQCIHPQMVSDSCSSFQMFLFFAQLFMTPRPSKIISMSKCLNATR